VSWHSTSSCAVFLLGPPTSIVAGPLAGGPSSDFAQHLKRSLGLGNVTELAGRWPLATSDSCSSSSSPYTGA